MIDDAGCDYIHVDVMDGHFVSNLTIGAPVIRHLRRCSNKPFDVHLMISPVRVLLEDFIAAGCDIITVHAEIDEDIPTILEIIRQFGVRTGLAIKPATPAQAVVPFLELTDLLLVMSVEPGRGGQPFMDHVLPKIAELRKLIDGSGRKIDLEVDGGINATTARAVIDAGADVLVAGTAVFERGANYYESNIEALRGD